MEDIDALGAYLKGQVGWVPLDRVKKTIDSKYADNRKLEAHRRLGLLDRDGSNIKLSERGRAYATSTDPQERAQIMGTALREVSLYADTVEWLHHSNVENPTKTVVGNYWHDKHPEQLEGAQGAALTDAVIFFMRVADAAGLGKFTRATGSNPETYLKTDASAIEAFVSGKSSSDPTDPAGTHLEPPAPTAQPAPNGQTPAQPTVTTPASPTPISVSTSPAIHVNIEIHIAANATAETVAEIFKNMRKYVLNNPDDADA
jgi:hypothetical protein